ncbi:MAG: hypothetical protein ABFD80_13365, partial [Acidobacteriota bacterium]
MPGRHARKKKPRDGPASVSAPPAKPGGRSKKLLFILAAAGLVVAALLLYRGLSTGFLAGRTRWVRSIMTAPGALET